MESSTQVTQVQKAPAKPVNTKAPGYNTDEIDLLELWDAICGILPPDTARPGAGDAAGGGASSDREEFYRYN